MPKFAHFEVVRVKDSPRTEKFGIAQREGVVLGISGGQEPHYSVSLGERSYFVAESDLESCGRLVPAEEFYDGTSIRVSPEGELLGRENGGTDSSS